MPTGYTNRVTKQNFTEFTMGCLPDFDLYSRDYGFQTVVEPSNYHAGMAQELRDKLKNEKQNEEDYKNDLESYARSIERKVKQELAYRYMLSKANEWTPPTERHIEFKNFMVEQLSLSLDFDCGYQPTKPALKTIEQCRKKIQEEIEYHELEHAKEVDRVARRNEWIHQLIESLQQQEARP